jgi:hypothetical protein
MRADTAGTVVSPGHGRGLQEAAPRPGPSSPGRRAATVPGSGAVEWRPAGLLLSASEPGAGSGPFAGRPCMFGVCSYEGSDAGSRSTASGVSR